MLGCFDQGLLRFIRAGRVFYRTSEFNCNWGRRNDEISTGTFTVPAAENCCPPTIHARADMVEFERNGVVQWAGYCMKPTTTDGVLSIEAMDLLDGYQRRIIRTGINVVGTDLSDIAAAVMASADDGDPIPVVPIFSPTGILADRIYTIDEYRIAWDALKNDLLNVGLDMTMVGTLLYVGPVENRNLRALKLRESMIEGVPATGEDGAAYANRIIAKGQNGLVSIYPPGPPVAPAPYPLVEAVVDANDTEDQATLDLLAQQHYDLRSAVPRFIALDQAVRLKADSPYRLEDYIPGRLVDAKLDTTCVQFQQAMRLQNVDYSLTAGQEEIKISTVPTGTVAAGVLA